MSFQLSLHHFRSFGEKQTALVRPLTILVGENNSGKSSFLAATRFMLQWASGAEAPSFNASPFYLGTFENIAHYRGGKYGRDRSFCLGIRRLENKSSPRKDWGEDVQITFHNNSGETAVEKIQVSTPNNTLIATQESERLQFAGSALPRAEFSINTEAGDNVPLSFYAQSSRLFRNIFYEIGAYTASGSGLHRSRIAHSEQFADLEQAIRRLQTRLPRITRASSPVRTEPERTYDPSRAPPTNDPNRSIFELAQFLNSNTPNVEGVRASLNAFGASSGLFSGLDIKRLGRSESDPFRIFVNASGRKANIADVGYGVSQVLPLLFELSRHTANTTYLLQQPEVHLHPRAQAQLGTEVAKTVSEIGGYVIVETHSDYFVDRVRSSIRDGILKKEDVSILFFKLDGFNSGISQVELDDTGAISKEPPGYRNFFIRETLRSLGVS